MVVGVRVGDGGGTGLSSMEGAHCTGNVRGDYVRIDGAGAFIVRVSDEKFWIILNFPGCSVWEQWIRGKSEMRVRCFQFVARTADPRNYLC